MQLFTILCCFIWLFITTTYLVNMCIWMRVFNGFEIWYVFFDPWLDSLISSQYMDASTYYLWLIGWIINFLCCHGNHLSDMIFLSSQVLISPFLCLRLSWNQLISWFLSTYLLTAYGSWYFIPKYFGCGVSILGICFIKMNEYLKIYTELKCVWISTCVIILELSWINTVHLQILAQSKCSWTGIF